MVSSGTTATSKLTISIPAATSTGSYTITVTGTNGSSSTHTTGISVSVVSPSSPDFTINSSPTSLTVAQGSSGTASAKLTSVNSFSGTVTLTATVSPTSPQVSLNPSSVSLTSGGSTTSVLTVSAATYRSTLVAQGNYAVNVTASSGSLSHSTTVSLAVGPTNSPTTGSSSLPLLPIIGGVIGAIVVVGVALFLVRRKT
jgi:LPXTG-motif cell wall-anchored protein